MLNIPPPVLQRLPNIPFDKFGDSFSWQAFEGMCQALAAEAFEVEEVRPYGVAGDKQEGIDIYAYDQVTNRYLVIQCKRVKHFAPAEIRQAVDLFLDGYFAGRSKLFILCTSENLSKGERQKELLEQEQRLGKAGIAFRRWDFNGLNEELKKYPQVVGNVFGPDYVRAFNGEEAYEAFMSKYKPAAKRPQKLQYLLDENYIQRTISVPGSFPRSVFRGIEEKLPTLLDIVTDTDRRVHRVILLSFGGYGKTAELNFVAASLNQMESPLYYPVQINLRFFDIDQPVEAMLTLECPGWEGVPGSELLILFDGLDEMGEKAFESFSKKVHGFLSQNKYASVIISSRTNYFNSAKGNALFNDFVPYVLDDLSYADIQRYLYRHLGNEIERFNQFAGKHQFSDLLSSPFYITSLVSVFKNSLKGITVLPSSRNGLMRSIIDLQLSDAEAKFAMDALDLSANRRLLSNLLEKIAFSMIYLSRSNLSVPEMQDIVPNDRERQLLRYSILDFKNGTYQFSHNLLQEYLAAVYISRLPLEGIRTLASFEPVYRKVKNKWLNTLTYLLSGMADGNAVRQSLTDWLVDVEPEVLVRMEKDKFRPALRLDIARRIIKKYSDMGINIPWQYFSERDLVLFAQSRELLEDCVRNLTESSALLQSRMQAGYMLQQFELFYGLEHTIKAQVLDCAIQEKEYPSLQRQAIQALIPLGIHVDVGDCFSKLVNCCPNLTNLEVRKAMLRLAGSFPEADRFVEFALASVMLFNKSKAQSRVMGEEWPIAAILLNAKTPTSVRRILSFINDDLELLKESGQKRVSFDKTFLAGIMNNAVNTFSVDDSVFDSIMFLVTRLGYRYRQQQYDECLMPFFDKTGTVQRAFNFSYHKLLQDSQNAWENAELMASFANEETLPLLVKSFQAGQISKDIVFLCLNFLRQRNPALHDWFYKHANKVTRNSLVYPKSFDAAAQRFKQQRRNQEMLLDRSLFFREIEKVFTALKKQKLSKNELWDYHKKFFRDEEKMSNTLALEVIRDWAEEDGQAEFQPIYAHYSIDAHWENYILHHTYVMQSGNTPGLILPGLQELATRLIFEKMKGTDFSRVIRDMPEGGYSYNTYVVWFNLFCARWDLDLPQEMLLGLLSTDTYSLHEYEEKEYRDRPSTFVIRKLGNNELVKQKVMENLRGGFLAKPVLGAHFFVCKALLITEARGFIFKELEGSRFSEHDKPKLMDIYLLLGGETGDLLGYYKNTVSADYWFWDLTKRLKLHYSGKVREVLA